MNDKKKEDIYAAFRIYLDDILSLNGKSKGNDVSWIRYLANHHDVFAIETEEDVKRIMDYEKYLMQQPERDKYRKMRDLTNFRHALKLFLPFMKCWREAEESRLRAKTYDDMIKQVGEQACLDHAKAIYEAALLCAYQCDYHFTQEQKRLMNANMAKFDSRFSVEKFFGPGSNYYSNK